jgi:hypothetical protein
MPSVAVNPPKTPVTKGSNGIAAATIPNVCKMPGPPAPFVPTPLPNIGQSGKSPQGYSTSVKVEGQPVAIKGASFGSSGDIASKGTGGGIISNNAEGPTKFLGPGSFNTKFEGKNVQLLADPMLNNCGPAGSPANAATLAGVLQSPEAVQAGVFAEAQEICDIHCDCVAKGDASQVCIDQELFRRDAETGFSRRTKSEVPFDMKTDPPSPYMSRSDPRRQTRNWRIGGSRRPDAIVVHNPARPWSGDNIAAVIECKWGADSFGEKQRDAYEEIAGGKEKLIVLDDSNCQCPDQPKPQPVPVPVPKRSPEPKRTPDWVGPVATAATVVGAVALAAAAVAGAPAVAAAAAVVAVFGLLGGGASSGGGDAI